MALTIPIEISAWEAEQLVALLGGKAISIEIQGRFEGDLVTVQVTRSKD